MRKIQIGKIYRHFKGNYCIVEKVVFDSETLKECVVYTEFYDNRTWVRPLDMFMDDIDPNRTGNITGQSHRFEFAEDISKNYLLR